MAVSTLLILYICATAIAAPPSPPISSLPNDAKNLNINATSLSALAALTSELNAHIPCLHTNMTTNLLPPSPFILPLFPGTISFVHPSYTSLPGDLCLVLVLASTEALYHNPSSLILAPLAYQIGRVSLALYPAPLLTWGVWIQALEALFTFRLLFPNVAYAFRIDGGAAFTMLVAFGSVMAF